MRSRPGQVAVRAASTEDDAETRALLQRLLQGQRQLAGEVQRLTAAVERQAAPVPSQHGDDDALAAIVGLVGDRPFFAREVWAAARVDLQLRQALDAILVDNVLLIGNLLSRCHRRGLIGRDVKPRRRGVRWRFDRAPLR